MAELTGRRRIAPREHLAARLRPGPARPVDPREQAPTPDWGITAMPGWLDTAAGREAWARAGEPDADPLESGETDYGTTDHENGDGPAGDYRTGDLSERGRSDEVDLADLFDSDDPEVPRRRFAIAPPAAIGLILVAVLACVAAVTGLLWGDGDPVPQIDFPPTAGPTDPASGAGPAETRAAGGGAGETGYDTAEPTEIVVAVVGRVERPGLLRLPPGTRVAEALESAGGAGSGADLLSLNLAQPLADGDQVVVGALGGEGPRSSVVGPGGAAVGGGAGGSDAPARGPATGGGGAAAGKVNLNSATEAELDALPGVGPVTAGAIIAWRERNGGFANVDQLSEVDGIGPARLAALRDLVTV